LLKIRFVLQKYIPHFAEPVTVIIENDEIGQGFWIIAPAFYWQLISIIL